VARRIILGCLVAGAGALLLAAGSTARIGIHLDELLVTKSVNLRAHDSEHPVQTVRLRCPRGWMAVQGAATFIPPGVLSFSSYLDAPMIDPPPPAEKRGGHRSSWEFRFVNSQTSKQMVKVQLRCIRFKRGHRRLKPPVDAMYKVRALHANDDVETTVTCPRGEVAVGDGFTESAGGHKPPPDDAVDVLSESVFHGRTYVVGNRPPSYSGGFFYVAQAVCVGKNLGHGATIKIDSIEKTKPIDTAAFKIIDLACTGDSVPLSSGFPPVPEGITPFQNVPGGDIHSQPVQFLNGSGHPDKVTGVLTCMDINF
jgi:hypothetical protein